MIINKAFQINEIIQQKPVNEQTTTESNAANKASNFTSAEKILVLLISAFLLIFLNAYIL